MIALHKYSSILVSIFYATRQMDGIMYYKHDSECPDIQLSLNILIKYELRVYWWKNRKIVLINYDFSRRDREAIKDRMKERN